MKKNNLLFTPLYKLICFYLANGEFKSGKELEELITKNGVDADFKNISYEIKKHHKNGIFEIINVAGKGYIYIANANETYHKLIQQQIDKKIEHGKSELFIYNRLGQNLNKTIKILGE